MDYTEALTDAGRARWGDRDVDLALSTITRTWYSRDQSRKREVNSFRLSFELLTPHEYGPDTREFPTDEARQAYISLGISSFVSRQESAAAHVPWTPYYESWRGCLVKRTEVEPVSETLVLSMAGSRSRIELLPEFRGPDGAIAPLSGEYGRAIASLSGQTIADVDVFLDDGLVILFSQAELAISADRLWSSPWPEDIENVIGGQTIPPPPTDHVTFTDAD